QLEGVAASRGEWQSLPDPAKRLLRGTQGGSADIGPTPPRQPAGHPRSYADLFGPPTRSPWAPGEFFAVVSQGLHDARLIPMSAAMREGSPGQGGFMLPIEVEYRLMDVPLHTSIVLPRAEVVPMSSRTKLVPAYDGTDQSSTMYGFSFSWLKENEEVTAGEARVRALELVARPGAIY